MTDAQFILVVEDDPILKNLLGHTFADKYQTLYANDGQQALALFEQYKPRLVLLDLMLPILDGFGVLQAIRSRTDDFKNAPVIIVSNLGQEKDHERAMSLGATEYLVKAEVSIEEIVGHIQAILEKMPVPAAPAVAPAETPATPAVPATAPVTEAPPAA
jgi:DNA-binding response OmpR family regulator